MENENNFLEIDKAIEDAKASVLPYECWEQLTGESSRAFSAFCVFRDLGADRSIKKAAEKSLNCGKENIKEIENCCRNWRNWATKWRWKERAVAYDRYLEQLKQTELRKTIEAQAEKHREVTGKMLDKVSRKLDLMNPEDLTQNNVTEWALMAIKAEREAAGLTAVKTEPKQAEFSFEPEFQGL